ncbi:TraI domain-containing protein [Cupriavidus pauculus]|uniref:Type VI secretion protein n=1 Tax=Cupriavidus pauculus TaxID=82633 RepID=A0A3G8HAD3_9BURK|nr:TraI domain-containing protein [Cupriavidus pauculus]AZG17366.1 type VI secretion protein [Cupriavidus pauculus]
MSTHTHTSMPAAALLSAHESRIALIRQYANEVSGDLFATKWLSILTRCADWFSSMPLRFAEHAEPGGAFRATVEAAYFAMRLSGAQKFGADQPSERRRMLEPQYLYALFLAACCSRLDEPCRHFQFYRDSDGAEWIPAAHGAFGPWVGTSTYRVTRREAIHPIERMRTALLAREILGSERLSAFDSQVLTELLGAINPDPRPTGLETLLHKVVRQSIDTLTQFEIKARKAEFAPDSTPVPNAEVLEKAINPSMTQAVTTAPSAPAKPTDETGNGLQAESSVTGSQAIIEAPDTTAAETSAERNVVQLDGARSLRRESSADDPFKALAGASNLMREFFKALAQDVASGKAKIARIDGKVSISKRSLGNYGLASDTLIEHLRKGKHLYKVDGQNILLIDEVGRLIAPETAS